MDTDASVIKHAPCASLYLHSSNTLTISSRHDETERDMSHQHWHVRHKHSNTVRSTHFAVALYNGLSGPRDKSRSEISLNSSSARESSSDGYDEGRLVSIFIWFSVCYDLSGSTHATQEIANAGRCDTKVVDRQ